MPIPDFQALMLPLLQIASDKQEHVFRDAVEMAARQFGLTDEERRELLPSGRQPRFDNRVGWAITYLSKAGLLERTGRGRFRITEGGIKVSGDNLARIDVNYLSQFEGYQEFRKRPEEDAEGHEEEEPILIEATPETPDEAIEAAYQRLRANLAQELLERIKKVAPRFFEELVVDLLVAMGYGGSRADAARIVGKVGDGGIDGVINEDRLGLDVVYIQAKRWDNRNVGSQELREFVGALSGRKASKGVYITTASFTEDARLYVREVPQKIVLIDGAQLAQLMIDYEVGITTEQKYEVKRVDVDYFEGV